MYPIKTQKSTETTDNNGLWGHSSPLGGRTFVLFAPDNKRIKDVQKLLVEQEIPYKPMIGTWEGDIEQSYLVDTQAFEDAIRPSGFVDNQEAFLYLGTADARDNRPASFLYTDSGVKEHIGTMTEVSKAYLTDNNVSGWTYDIILDKYFTIL